MRFVRYLGASGPEVGVVHDDVVRIVEGVDDLLPLLQDGLPALLAVGDRAVASHVAPVPLAGLDILSPIATPPTVRDFYAFEQHVRAGRAARGLEMDPDWYDLPVFYFSNPYAVNGCGEVAMPPDTSEFDFELEVAAVLGGGGHDLTAEQGEDLVLGYCVLNDWSARDVQRREMRQSLGPAKGKDSATGLGPYLVTKDELADVREGTGYRLAMTCSVNGTPYSSAMWSDVHIGFGEMVAHASRGSEVRAGDVIGSGTCGTGCILELALTHGSDRYPWLQPGDVVRASIERLGTLTNTVGAARPRSGSE